VGNRDVEDSLRSLDRLTQEEARMAFAESLKVTHNVDDKVMEVDDRVKGVEVKVQGVCDDVKDYRDDVQGVANKVQDVRGDVRDVGDKAQDVDDRVQDIGKDIPIEVVDDKLDQANRPLFLKHLLIIPTTQTTSQGTSSETTFYDGYRPQIHPPITTWHPKLIIMVQRNGSSEAVYSVNGNQPAPSCGYTENVRYILP
jgi:hypothetical protein